jgi:hypothetical protein
MCPRDRRGLSRRVRVVAQSSVCVSRPVALSVMAAQHTYLQLPDNGLAKVLGPGVDA